MVEVAAKVVTVLLADSSTPSIKTDIPIAAYPTQFKTDGGLDNVEIAKGRLSAYVSKLTEFYQTKFDEIADDYDDQLEEFFKSVDEASREKLDLFYNLTRTPVVEGEVVSQPCTLPAGVEAADRAMLCTAFGLEIPKPSGTSVAGFLAGWAAVAALVGGFVWLVN